ncbi:MAG: 7-cyano-7-deazaguanine synthase QueC [Myxococcales bacterium FL481]|nr:MAG: 7-cyano-7-deazaguanine synthase QueC [Myxococcales bacterium FL481]
MAPLPSVTPDTVVPPAAVVLVSGGLDSTTVLAAARAQGRAVYALSFDYGQRHASELGCARRQAQRWSVRDHRVVALHDFASMVSNATALVTQSAIEVPRARDVQDRGEVPVTYVPARNLLFLAYATAWAESLDAQEIWIGANVLDYSGYPDCRPAFFESFRATANLGTRAADGGPQLEIVAPLLNLSKHEIIAWGLQLGVDYADTISCYAPSAAKGSPGVVACGTCDSCQLRRRGFARAGVDDPTTYAVLDA